MYFGEIVSANTWITNATTPDGYVYRIKTPCACHVVQYCVVFDDGLKNTFTFILWKGQLYPVTRYRGWYEESATVTKINVNGESYYSAYVSYNGYLFELADIGAGSFFNGTGMSLEEVLALALENNKPTITAVVLNETELSLYPGNTFQFEATVEGTGIFDTSVFYSLISIDPNSSTEIGQSSGLLYIDPNETKSVIQVFVQAVGDPDVYAVATVTILDPNDPGGGEDPDPGGGEDPDPVPDIKPVYLRTSGTWVKVTAYERQAGEWVLISTAGG